MVMKDDVEGLGAINSDFRSFTFLKDFLTSDLRIIWRTRAENARRAKMIYEEETGADAPNKAVFRPFRGVLNEAKRVQQKESLSDLLIKEVLAQKRNSPLLFGDNAFNTDPIIAKDNLDANIIDKIAQWEFRPELMPVEEPIVGRATAEVKNRITYLKSILRNINSALGIFNKNNVPDDNEAFEVLEKQKELANKELKIGNDVVLKRLYNNNNRYVRRYAGSNRALGFTAPFLIKGHYAPTAVVTSDDIIQPPYIPQKLNRGGIVYANEGTMVPYAPRGTDTVPAMLTPGEFVVNRSSAAKHLPVLQAINNGYYSRGGSVSYLAGGTPGIDALHKSLAYLTDILRSGADELQRNLTNLSKLFNNMDILNKDSEATRGVSNNVNYNAPNPAVTIDALGNRLDNFIKQLQNVIPPVVRVEGQHTVNVQITGGTLLQELLKGPLGGIVEKAINAAFEQRNIKNEGSNR
jgi:hypothetical protein